MRTAKVDMLGTAEQYAKAEHLTVFFRHVLSGEVCFSLIRNCGGNRGPALHRFDISSTSYRIENPRNPENRRKMANASFSAYVLVKNLRKTGEKCTFLTKKSTTNFGLPFCFFPFPVFCLKMAKICCFCLAKSQKRRQKTRPPPEK